MRKYLVILEVVSDFDEEEFPGVLEATAEEVHEGLCQLLHEQVDDGDWNKGKFAVTNVYMPQEVAQ